MNKFLKSIIYIKLNRYYETENSKKHTIEKHYYSNRLLVIGFLRCIFGFKLFKYIYLWKYSCYKPYN